MAWTPHERRALADALTTAGPGARTLCEGWRTEHLAAHVVLRETAPIAAVGLAVPPLAVRSEQAVQDLGDRSATPYGFSALVDRIRGGPPAWYPVAWLGDAGNLLELLVHTEDVRRGGPGGAQVEPRVLPERLEDAVWRWLTRTTRLAYRRSPVDLLLTDGVREHRVRSRTAARRGRTDGPVVEVRGEVTELVLHAFDRAWVAHVTLDGQPDAVQALDRVRRR